MSSFGKHTRNAGYQPGSHWVECQRCSFDIRAKDIRKEWTGLLVCPECWEPRHTLDVIRSKPDRESPKGPVNPAGPENSADLGILSCYTDNAVSGHAVAGCAVAGNDYNGAGVESLPSPTFGGGSQL